MVAFTSPGRMAQFPGRIQEPTTKTDPIVLAVERMCAKRPAEVKIDCASQKITMEIGAHDYGLLCAGTVGSQYDARNDRGGLSEGALVRFEQ